MNGAGHSSSSPVLVFYPFPRATRHLFPRVGRERESGGRGHESRPGRGQGGGRVGSAAGGKVREGKEKDEEERREGCAGEQIGRITKVYIMRKEEMRVRWKGVRYGRS